MKIKTRTKVSAWRNKDEFAKVHELLFGVPGKSNRTKALQAMTIWKIRRGAETPASVLSTMAIVEVQLKDEHNQQTGAIAEHDIRSMYSSAFTRFLNYISQVEQKGKRKTMYAIAKSLGIESFLVDLRHLCSHGQQMPSLDVFRRSANYCVRWLKSFYWDRELRHICDTDVHNIRIFNTVRFEGNAARLFFIYDAVTEAMRSGLVFVDKLQISQNNFDEYVAQLQERRLEKIRDAVVGDLVTAAKSRVVKDSVSIICDQFLRVKNIIDTTVKALNGITDAEKVTKSNEKLFKEFEKIGALEKCFQRFVFTAESELDDPRKCATAGFWAEYLLQRMIETNAGLKFDRNYVVERLKNITKHSKVLIERLIDLSEEGAFSSTQKQCLLELTELFAGNSDEAEAALKKLNHIYTMEGDVLSKMSQDERMEVEKSEKLGIWKKDSGEINWKNLPIGAVLNEPVAS